MPNLRLTLYALIAGAFLGIAIWLHFERKGHAHWRSEYARLSGELKVAQDAADEAARVNVIAVTNEQAAVTEGIEDVHALSLASLRADRDRLRAVADRLRAEARIRRTSEAALSGISGAPTVTDDPDMSVPASALMSAQEIELRANDLVEWVKKQKRINNNGVGNAADSQPGRVH